MTHGDAITQEKETILFFSSPHRSYSRIDLFLVDQHLLSRTINTTISTITWPDHASVTLTIVDSISTGATPIWRASPLLLQREDTRKILETHLKNYLADNVGSVDNYFTMWNGHKAFMCGIFIKLGAGVRRQRQRRIKELAEGIRVLEIQNKQNPLSSLSHKLAQIRYDLRMGLMEDFEKSTRRLKMNYYANGNKAGKILANRLRGFRCKARTPYIIHPTTNFKHCHPRDIADAFSDYYRTLYNLENDPLTHQPDQALIAGFLAKLSLPQLTTNQLHQLNLPFSSKK